MRIDLVRFDCLLLLLAASGLLLLLRLAQLTC